MLLSLSQSATQHSSHSAASQVYEELRRVGKTHGRRVQQARFVVLKSPDIPSMLVETGFISNPTEERNLRDPGHQERLAKAIMQGLKEFFVESPPPGTLLAERKKVPVRHVIAKGDTLSEIADRYQVSLAMLRQTNEIRSDHLIRIGQVLVISFFAALALGHGSAHVALLAAVYLLMGVFTTANGLPQTRILLASCPRDRITHALAASQVVIAISSGISRLGSASRAAAGIKPILRPIACSTNTGSAGQLPAFSSLANCTMCDQ